MKFFCTLPLKICRFSIRLRSSSVKAMFTLKRRLLPRQRVQVPLELNKRIPLRLDISKDLSCKLFDEKLQNLIEAT